MAEMPVKGDRYEKNGDGFKERDYFSRSRDREKEKVRGNEGDEDGDKERDRDRERRLRDKSDGTERERSRDDDYSHPSRDYDSKSVSGFDVAPPAAAKNQRMKSIKNNKMPKFSFKKLLARLKEDDDLPLDILKPEEQSYKTTMTKEEQEELDNFVAEVYDGDGDDLF
ncbi:hypothetical protein ACHQM5_027703 [Ranunculus cassubicifolius]